MSLEYSAELRMGSREQHASKGLKEKVASVRVNRIKKPLEYCKVENPLYVDQHHEQNHSASNEPEVYHRHSLTNHNRQCSKSMGDKNDDLVKHMRNLPGYLQCEGNGENLQGKALNFGVLDWGRLENWKFNEKRIPPRYNMNTSPYCNNSTLVENGAARVSRATNKILPSQKDQQASNGHPLSSPSVGRLSPGVRWPRGKAVKVQNSEISPGCMLDDLSSGRNYHEVEEPNSSKGKQGEQMTSSDWRNHDTRRAQASATKMQSEENINHADDPSLSSHQNVALCSPADFPLNSSSDDLWLSESNKSCDGSNLTEENETTLSNWSEEFHSMNPFSEVPHSCPFPFGAATNPEPECPFATPITALKGTSLEEKKSEGGHVTRAVQPYVKRTYSSPNRRFSFSLGKMGRSLSFTETSAAPQLCPTYTSVKSGPVNFEASPDLCNYNLKKGSASTRSRSSPLRRLLDPLLKHKGAPVAPKVQQSNRDLNSTSVNPINAEELLNGKKQRSSNVQALLQLTMKNGVPFFKLVVDSSSDILAAAVKKLPTYGKDDSSLIYAFYSVHEIKKKSWINHGSKGKRCGFGYNIVGEMKISSSYHAEFSGPANDLNVVRESVLYSTDIVRADQKTSDCMPGRELAAIIVKNPSDENHEDIASSKSMVVIVPGGIHTIPNCGLPSPLIKRWRCGGTCDCGGWDIGCQFRILTNHNEMVKAPSPNRVDLCFQGGPENKHALSLVPLQDGLYSVEYDDASLSLLQAFSVCVAVVSGQRLSHIFQADHVAQEAKDATTGNEEVKSEAAAAEAEIPARYVSKPPASPVGRV